MTARLENPTVPDTVIEVPDSAVGHLAMSGWVPAKGEPVPACPTCGSVWPAYAEQPKPPDEQQANQAPAEETGASASKARRRRTSSEESE